MKDLLVFLVFCTCLVAAQNPSCTGHSVQELQYAKTPDGFCPFIFYSGLNRPRSILTVSNGDILVLEAGAAQVTVLFSKDGSISKAKLASATGLNHGVAVSPGFLYASNPTTVFRWQYTPGTRQDLGQPQTVVTGIPCCHHITRTIVFDSNGNLYVQSGSGSNVDPDPSHSQIRRFSLAQLLRNTTLDWTNDGELFASGIRNEVGLTFDSKGRLFGVENGRDDLYRADLGGDIHNDNPCERVNLFEKPGAFYGYPYCFSQFALQLEKTPPGTMWADPGFMPKYTDAWCRNLSNVIPPAFPLPAHLAPLSILFVGGNSFPSQYQGAYVTSHGSWDRNPPVGYSVILLSLNSDGMPVSQQTVLSYNNPSTVKDPVKWTHRPVSLTTTKCSFGDCLLISSDSNGLILGLGYAQKN